MGVERNVQHEPLPWGVVERDLPNCLLETTVKLTMRRVLIQRDGFVEIVVAHRWFGVDFDRAVEKLAVALGNLRGRERRSVGG